MPSELNDLSQDTLLNQNPQNNSTNSQYGLDRSDLRPLRQPRTGEERSKSRRSASSASSSTSSGAGSDHNSDRSLRGLRRNPPVDRIAEHERSLTYLPKNKAQGPGFAIVQRGRIASTNQVTLADFPNGSVFSPSLIVASADYFQRF